MPQTKALSIYVNVPFGAAGLNADAATQAAYTQAVLTEAETAAPDFAQRQANSIFLGGSPLALPANGAEKLLRGLTAQLAPAPDAQITVQASPEQLTSARMEALCALGVNRIALDMVTGSVYDGQRVGLAHTQAAAQTALILVQMYHLCSYEARLGYGLPGQTADSLRVSLRLASRFHTPEILLYPWQGQDAQPQGEQQTLAAAASEFLVSRDYTEYMPGRWAKPDHRDVWALAQAGTGDCLCLGVDTQSRTDGVYYHTTAALGKYLYHADDPQVIYTVLGRAECDI